MKICITSQGEKLDSQVDPRFGRCQYYVIYDTEAEKFNVEKNPYINAAGGAGIQAGQMITDKGVQVVLTGNVGPNAFRTLQAGNLEVVTGITGTVKETIEKYQQGKLNSTDSPTVNSKFGVSGGGKAGRGMKSSRNISSPEESSQKNAKEEELNKLEKEADILEKKVKEIRKKIDEKKEKGDS